MSFLDGGPARKTGRAALFRPELLALFGGVHIGCDLAQAEVQHRALLGAVAARMTSKPRDYEVLVQGTLSRKELLERFRDLETSVLIGSVSFREGIDVPGESLTQVIIDRIPFPHPSDPVVQARNDLESGKSFMSFTLPMATLLLRQAVGRLIRTASDRGRVVILDRRLLDRPDWGILSSLPRVPCRRLRVRNSAKNVAASGSL